MHDFRVQNCILTAPLSRRELPDAQPNEGDWTTEGLLQRLSDNADRNIFTTIIGVGVDFNTELVEVRWGGGGGLFSCLCPPPTPGRLDAACWTPGARRRGAPGRRGARRGPEARSAYIPKRPLPAFSLLLTPAAAPPSALQSISKVKGAQYYSVHPPGEFQRRLVQDFNYSVNPLVFDLELRVDPGSLATAAGARGWRILQASGPQRARSRARTD